MKHLEIGDFNGIGAEGILGLSSLTLLEHLRIGGWNSIGKSGARALLSFTSLRHLFIGHMNGIEREGLEMISFLVHLQHLEIWGKNDIRPIDMAVLSSLIKLRFLAVEFRLEQLEDCSSGGIAAFGSLDALEHLKICGYFCTLEDISMLGSLVNLRHLVVDCGDWDEYCLEEQEAAEKGVFAPFCNLRHLELWNGNLGKRGSKEISCLTKLQTLKLCGMKLGPKSVKELSCLSNLQHLEFVPNPIPRLCLDEEEILALSLLPKLEYLTFYNTSFGPMSVSALASLAKVNHLEIGDDCEIGLIGAQAIARLAELKVLHIGRNNSIGLLGIQALASLANLKTFLLKEDGNALPENAPEVLRKCFAKTDIMLDWDWNKL